MRWITVRKSGWAADRGCESGVLESINASKVTCGQRRLRENDDASNSNERRAFPETLLRYTFSTNYGVKSIGKALFFS